MNTKASDSSGDLAYESGSYEEEITVVATGEQKRLTGDYVTVYHRAKSGKWLIVQQVWTEASGRK